VTVVPTHRVQRNLPPASSTVVVFVPGLGLDAREWAGTRALLAGPSVVVTLPSLGQSAPRGTGLHVEQQSQRVLATLPTDCDLVLVGHSASCPIVVEAARHHQRVVGLVLIGPVTDPTARSWPRMLIRWLGTAARERLWELVVLAPQYSSTGPSSMLRGMTQIRRYRTHTGLSRLPIPTHIIRGQHDRIASAQWCAQLASRSLTERVCVPRAAHMLPLTHPHVIAASAERLRHGARRNTAPTSPAEPPGPKADQLG
jgi:pimeloyl-ACP methyl ester carboxylesterase